MPASAAADVAGTYFDAWKAGDFTRLRSILADDATFDGPLGHAGNADECTWIRVTFDPRPLSSS